MRGCCHTLDPSYDEEEKEQGDDYGDDDNDDHNKMLACHQMRKTCIRVHIWISDAYRRGFRQVGPVWPSIFALKCGGLKF